jgi:hypothetical protein
MTFTFLHIPPCVLNGFPIKITRMAINHDRVRGDGHFFHTVEDWKQKAFLHVPL